MIFTTISKDTTMSIALSGSLDQSHRKRFCRESMPTFNSNNDSTITKIPFELINHAFTFLPLQDAYRAKLVCKEWSIIDVKEVLIHQLLERKGHIDTDAIELFSKWHPLKGKKKEKARWRDIVQSLRKITSMEMSPKYSNGIQYFRPKCFGPHLELCKKIRFYGPYVPTYLNKEVFHGIANCKGVENLEIICSKEKSSREAISALREIVKMKKLVTLELQLDNFPDDIVKSIAELPHLTKLTLRRPPTVAIRLLSHCKNLQHLVLTCAPFLRVQISENLFDEFEHYPSLQSLDVSAFSLGEGFSVIGLSSIAKCKSLTSLSMATIPALAFKALAPLTKLNTLTLFFSTGDEIDDKCASELASSLPRLRHLSTSLYHLTEDGLNSIASIKTLEKISGYKITNKAFKIFVESLPNLTNISQVEASLKGEFSNLPEKPIAKLITLELSDYNSSIFADSNTTSFNINDLGVKDLVKRFPEIQTLDLRSRKITPFAFLHIEMLKNLTSLRLTLFMEEDITMWDSFVRMESLKHLNIETTDHTINKPLKMRIFHRIKNLEELEIFIRGDAADVDLFMSLQEERKSLKISLPYNERFNEFRHGLRSAKFIEGPKEFRGDSEIPKSEF